MAITISPTLKAVSLKQIAFKCGIQISGTKPLLSQRIQDELPNLSFSPSNSTKPIRILSIDMGIRNLAYSLLEISPSKPSTKKKTPLPVLQSWQKLSLLPQNTDTNADSKVSNEFTPAILANAAYKLLRNDLLPLSPTLILIERQRFRSMGSKHILEWTIRVNMLESMLWAILKTLREEGVWDGEVREVAPRKVGEFWVAEEGQVDGNELFRKVRSAKEAKARNKGAKIDLVRRWLEEETVVVMGGEDVKKIRERYMNKWGRKVGRIKGKKAAVSDEEKAKDREEMGKLDDLADCLLQGMAWIKWEENKRNALKNGVEILLEN